MLKRKTKDSASPANAAARNDKIFFISCRVGIIFPWDCLLPILYTVAMPGFNRRDEEDWFAFVLIEIEKRIAALIAENEIMIFD